MSFIDMLTERNAKFASTSHSPDLKIIPSRRWMIVGCVDPRVDPMDVLQLEPGEAAIIRNVGGRVNPALFETLDILRTVSHVGGQDLGPGWNLILLQHTKCGIVGCYRHAPALLSKYMGVQDAQLPALAIEDPHKAVEIDVAALRANPSVPGEFTVTGLVYDVDSGHVQVVVPPAVLRPA